MSVTAHYRKKLEKEDIKRLSKEVMLFHEPAWYFLISF